MAEVKVKIPGMMCMHCEKKVRAAIEKAEWTVKSLDLDTKEVAVECDATPEKVAEVLKAAGYDAEIL